MPSREKLRAFVNHVRTLTQKDENGDDGFDREYKSIKDLQLTIKDDPKYPVEDGRLPCNKKKNRYKDILPFDFCRVALTPTHDEGSDYINASFLQDVNGENGYIAAMGPLTATLNDYWRMLWEYGIKTVVMVCKEVELGKKKCAKYWPDDLDSSVSFAGVTVRVMDESQRSGEIDVRVLEAEFKGERRTIMQYHFQSWPDHGVPESAQPIVDLIQIFREHQPTNNPPIVVHCSAGCGRTGTVCAVDYAWQLLESQIESDVSVLEIVSMFRHQRLSMVQTKDQYVLIYKAVLKLEGKEFLERQPPAAEPEPAEPAAEADPEPAAEAAPEPEPAKAEEAKPAASLKRDSTMAATAKEGLAFLESHPARQQPSTDNNNSASPPAAAPAANAEPAPELKRDGTMIATAKEAKTILGDAAPTGATRAESAAITSTSAVSEKTAEKRDHDGEDEGSAAKRVKE